jgi:hypothetical protein
MKKLFNVLLAKSIIETVFVGAIALVVYADAFPLVFHGWGEAVESSRSISGWVVSDANPWARIEVQLFIDGKFVGSQVAHLSRPDVVVSGWSKDEWHGYNFVVQGLTAGRHEARVYALHEGGKGYTLLLLGDPIAFEIRADGDWDVPR